jgi:beta-N-acetylhexosaminidase
VKQKQSVNLIFPIILFVLLCVAIIAVVSAPRSAEPGDTGATRPAATDAEKDIPDTPESPDPASETETPSGTEPDGGTEPEPQPEPADSGEEPNGAEEQTIPSEPSDPSELSDGRTEEQEPGTDGEPDPSEEPDPAKWEEEAEAGASEPGEPAVEEPDEPEPLPADEPEEPAEPEDEPPPFDTEPFIGTDEPENAEDPGEPEDSGTVRPAEISDSLTAFSPQVQAQIASMSTYQLLTQMFIATYDGSWATADYAAQYGFGGYITFAEDYEYDTPESFREGVDRVAAASAIPPLFAVDEEGGTVTRASKYPGYRRYPFLSPREVYEMGGIDGIRTDAAEKAELLKKLGLNYNLAPVADISVNSWDYMYNRSPGQDAETTSQIVETIVSVFNARGVASTVKHFPGYGAVSDTHTALAYDGRTVEELEGFDLIPFQRAMNAGVPSVMVSHIITALDPERPASVSSKVVDYIRNNMGYDGVLITDDMRMNGILDFCTSGNGSLEAILAGYDLICCTNWPEQFPVVWSAVESGELTRERLEISAARIIRMKQELGIWNP